jgi:hypothetical protein
MFEPRAARSAHCEAIGDGSELIAALGHNFTRAKRRRVNKTENETETATPTSG